VNNTINDIKENMKKFLLGLFFPSFCFGCQKEGTYLCPDCKAILEIMEFQYCLCNKNPSQIKLSLSENGKCDKCLNKNLSGLYFALSYKENILIKKLIYNFKYQPYIQNLSKTLALLLAEHFLVSGNNNEHMWQNGILVPVPLTKRKLKSRGYNQTEKLAKELSKILRIPVISNNLIKTKSTLSQINLSGKEREQNLKNAFMLKNPSEIAGKKIFLVDDVYTTGSTMEECARIFKENGIKNIWGIAIAREN